MQVILQRCSSKEQAVSWLKFTNNLWKLKNNSYANIVLFIRILNIQFFIQQII